MYIYVFPDELHTNFIQASANPHCAIDSVCAVPLTQTHSHTHAYTHTQISGVSVRYGTFHKLPLNHPHYHIYTVITLL